MCVDGNKLHALKTYLKTKSLKPNLLTQMDY